MLPLIPEDFELIKIFLLLLRYNWYNIFIYLLKKGKKFGRILDEISFSVCQYLAYT